MRAARRKEQRGGRCQWGAPPHAGFEALPGTTPHRAWLVARSTLLARQRSSLTRARARFHPAREVTCIGWLQGPWDRELLLRKAHGRNRSLCVCSFLCRLRCPRRTRNLRSIVRQRLERDWLAGHRSEVA